MKRAARPRAIMNPFPLKNNNNKREKRKKKEKENLIDTCNYSRSIIHGDTAVRRPKNGGERVRGDFYRDRSFVAYRQVYYFIDRTPTLPVFNYRPMSRRLISLWWNGRSSKALESKSISLEID